MTFTFAKCYLLVIHTGTEISGHGNSRMVSLLKLSGLFRVNIRVLALNAKLQSKANDLIRAAA